MTTETKSQGTSQILIWSGVVIVVLAIVYFVL
jgi:hypothetical protein